jgi:predicted RNA-binding Zn-ribbon protein involved in translation (DUF1610 family)
MNQTEFNYKLRVECYESPNFDANTIDVVTVAKVTTKEIAIVFAEAYALAIVKDYTELPVTLEDLPKDWEISCNDSKTRWTVKFKKTITNEIFVDRICPYCGNSPINEITGRVSHICPECGREI